MTHLPPLIQDLGFILIVAATTAIIFKLLRQPVALGYILAGLIVGPNLHITPTITEEASIQIWGEIGVVVLLFSLGLEFSFKKLVKVGGPSSITAFMEICMMLLSGYLLGRFYGMSQMDCFFLAGIMSISSTTIILRTFDELGVKAKNFAQVVMGVLIIEDLLAILILVLLSTMAVSVTIEGSQIFQAVLRLVFFLVFWFVFGIYFIPTIFRKTKQHLNDETLLILSLGLCLLMVIITTRLGFSSSLGAFLMGSILAETPLSERIEHIIKPIKELFGAIFFVSVGMLIDPKLIVEHWGLILIVSVMVMVIKPLGATIGALISGQQLKQSMQVGMTLSQIGEFSFIIATLGKSLNVTSGFLYPVAVSVAAVTTFTTPFMIRLSPRLFGVVDKLLPRKVRNAMMRYSADTQIIKTESTWKLYLKDYFMQVLIYAVLLIAIITVSARFLLPMVITGADPVSWKTLLVLLATLLAMGPFLWALAIRPVNKEVFTTLSLNKRNYGPLIVMRTLRIALAVFLVGFLVNSFFSEKVALLALATLIVLFLIFRKFIQRNYVKIEGRFLHNFNAEAEAQKAAQKRVLTPWDAHIVHFTIDPAATFAGQTLFELKFREQFGINIAKIKRGELSIPVPKRSERIFPNDDISVIGTDAQIEAFKKFLDTHKLVVSPENKPAPMTLYSVVMKEDKYAWYLNKTIFESGIRERTEGLIVGIERKGRRILNPESDMQIEKDDLLWIVGQEGGRKKIMVPS